jgi:hypothetical protein
MIVIYPYLELCFDKVEPLATKSFLHIPEAGQSYEGLLARARQGLGQWPGIPPFLSACEFQARLASEGQHSLNEQVLSKTLRRFRHVGWVEKRWFNA